jgi:hypothetical protein
VSRGMRLCSVGFQPAFSPYPTPVTLKFTPSRPPPRQKPGLLHLLFGLPTMIPDNFEFFVDLLLLCFMGWWFSIPIRYWILRHRSRNWVAVEATIQRGGIASVSFKSGVEAPVLFLGYAFTLEGHRYARFLAIYGVKREQLLPLQNSLPGQSISVLYNPSNPDESLLERYDDPRFAGTKATQNPLWLRQAPTFSLRESLRGSSALPSPPRK